MQVQAGRSDITPRTFVLAMVVIAVVGLGIRVVWAATRGPDRAVYDSAWYSGEAAALAAGKGFVDPAPTIFPFLPEHHRPDAQHPPVTALVLTPAAWLAPDHQLPLRLTLAGVGAAGVVLVGLLGRAVAGRRVGVVAAGVAAVYPFLWVNDGLIMSESIAVVLTVAALLLVLRLRRTPTWPTAIALGAVGGLAALTRSELVALVPALAVGVALARGDARRTRIVRAGAATATMVIVVAPWVAFNLSRFREPVFVTTAGETNLLASDCDATFRGPKLGSIGIKECFDPYGRGGDPSVAAVAYRRRALHYIRHHLDRYPVVVLARLGRDWSFFRPTQDTVFEGRPDWVTELGLVVYYPLVALAVGGAVVLRRRRGPLWPLLTPIVIVCLTTLGSWGQVRFRAPAEPALVVLAAVAVGAWWDRRTEPAAAVTAPATA